MVTAFQVSETLGRSGSHASTVWTRCERLLREKSDAESLGLIPVRVRCREIGGRWKVQAGAGLIEAWFSFGVWVLLGSLMHEIQEGKARKNSIGAGTSRVRSVLFKAVCDWLAVAPCSLQRQEPAKQENMVTWNTVQVDGDHYVVDVIFEPGALYEEGSGKAGEYLRRLESEGEDVFQGTWAGQPVAVKEVRDASPTDADVCDFVLEISLLSRLSHPNLGRRGSVSRLSLEKGIAHGAEGG
eukprot:g6706.t1